jgi:hypothetical protein
MGKQTERGRRGGSEDEVRAQVLAERLEVILPDRLVDARAGAGAFSQLTTPSEDSQAGKAALPPSWR